MKEGRVLRFDELPVFAKDDTCAHLGHLSEKEIGKTRWQHMAVDLDGFFEEMVEPLLGAHDEPDEERVVAVAKAIKKSGVITPIMIDEIRVEGPWFEGWHRIFAARLLGMKEIPAYVRVK